MFFVLLLRHNSGFKKKSNRPSGYSIFGSGSSGSTLKEEVFYYSIPYYLRVILMPMADRLGTLAVKSVLK